MYLEQLNLTYLPLEDRLLLRIGFKDKEPEKPKQEIQLYLTRRLLQRLWPSMMNAMTSHMRLNRPEAGFASADLVQMEHEDTVNQFKENGQFNQNYDSDNRESLNDGRPAIIQTVKFHLQPNAPLRMELFPESGGSIDLKLASRVLHGFCKLMLEAEKRSGWGLNLSLIGVQEIESGPRVLN
jgi:hypothetical protein